MAATSPDATLAAPKPTPFRRLVGILQPDKGDILAHPFTRHPGGFVSEKNGKVHPVVWEALDLTLDRTVAVKLMRPQLAERWAKRTKRQAG